MIKLLLIILGTISLTLGIIGIFIPGLPTTPFLLLTAGLYVRSSDRLYHRLISSKFIGTYIIEFQRKKGLTRRAKLYAIAAMWFMILISTHFFVKALIPRLIIIGAGIIGSIVMGFIVSTIQRQEQDIINKT